MATASLIRAPRAAGAARQRGISFMGMVFLAILIAFVGVVAIKVLPTLNEYFTIRRAVQKIADSGASSVPEIRRAFETQKQIEYSISDIGGSDLEIDTTGDKVKIRFAYDKEVEIMDPVFLLIKYRGGNR
ncbi:MAG TPA: DUF4845 domain-containing protein [Ideonella sp.]|uniref:DUF4845 domain-containing protein n=1 Tax=Ideonella sp. TaxID=1929293 RepID=UPI002B7CA300|nr:DUF4845 domain-containing protein [Ideonella sp.]HSI48459.1 DUF4845 domain-containing protein [Ideonella sp.]